MKRVRSIRLLATAMLVSGMTACSAVGSYVGIGSDDGWLRDRQGEYLNAQIAPAMQIPAELDSFTIDELYHIPQEAPGERALYVVPPAPKPIDSRIREGVVIQRFGDRAWIVIGATPGQVWPRLRDYFATEQIAMSVEDAVNGSMQTVWITQPDSDVRHKYRARVEPGLHAGNSEVYIQHVSDTGESAANEPLQWPEESISLDRETTLLASVSLYLADRTDIYRASSISLLAGSIDVQGKARVATAAAGDTRLELRLDYSRAWSQLNQAIGNANLQVLDADRDERRVRLMFTGVENLDQPGFFRRVFRGGSDNEEPAIEFNLLVEETGNGVSVRAETASGVPAPFQQDLLIRTINENLI